MTANTCLFIKPHTTTPEAILQQQKDFRAIVKPAVKQAGLTLLDADQEGVTVKGISPDLVKQVCEADIVVVDANCYETAGNFTLSPFLYYFIALCHTLGNRTILIARSTSHLQPSLQKHHTLDYSPQQPPDFYEKFESVIKAIQSGEDARPDNPVQEYHKEKKMAEDIAQARAEAIDKAAQVEKLKRELAAGRQAPSPTITFRRVS